MGIAHYPGQEWSAWRHGSIGHVAGGVEGADGADACAKAESTLVSGEELINNAELHGVTVGAQ